MKIGQQPDNTPAVGQAATSKTSQAVTPAGKNERKSPGVGVTVSSQARALERSGTAAEVDTNKVNALRLAIEQKNYMVNPEAIADKLLANAREMLDRSKG